MEWLENLSDDLKKDKSLADFRDVESLAKSYVNLKSMQGNSIRIAGPDASDEDRAAIYNKVMTHMPELMLKPDPDKPEQLKEFYSMLGVPEDVNGYEYEGTAIQSEVVAELRELAKQTHMTKQQWKAYVGRMEEMSSMTQQQREDARVRMGAELKSEWGMAFEDRYAVVEQFMKDNPGMGSVEQLTPDQMKATYQIAKSLVGRPQAHGQPAPQGRLTPNEAREQIREIENNPKFLSLAPEDRAEHKRLVEKRVDLMRLAEPVRYGVR